VRGRERRISIDFDPADALDFPLEQDTGSVEDAPPDLFAEAFEIGCGGGAGVDQKIGVLLRHHRTAADETATAGGVDQAPRTVAGWVLERRSAGTRAHWLGRFSRGADLV
jgi:hypothetical protein